MRRWAIDRGLAADLGALAGWDPDDGVAGLVTALAGSVPIGSTAKLAAVAAGEVPPGADVEAVARRVVEDRAADRPTVAWSCWAMSTLMAALLETAEVEGPVAVAAVRRVDDAALAVDLHSFVRAGGLIADPYFASVAPEAGPSGRVHVHGGVGCTRHDEGDGRWSVEVTTPRWARDLRYRLLAPVLDTGDVAALCAVSVTHTGAPPRPMAVLWRDGRGVDLASHAAGGVALRRWAPDLPPEVTEHPSWGAATEHFAAATGIRLA